MERKNNEKRTGRLSNLSEVFQLSKGRENFTFPIRHFVSAAAKQMEKYRRSHDRTGILYFF